MLNRRWFRHGLACSIQSVLDKATHKGGGKIFYAQQQDTDNNCGGNLNSHQGTVAQCQHSGTNLFCYDNGKKGNEGQTVDDTNPLVPREEDAAQARRKEKAGNQQTGIPIGSKQQASQAAQHRNGALASKGEQLNQQCNKE